MTDLNLFDAFTLDLSDALELAAAHVSKGNMDAAIEVCGQILAVDPANADAFHIKAHAFARQGAIDLACEAALQAQRIRPNDADIQQTASALAAHRATTSVGYREAGVAFGLAGQYDQAVPALEKAVELDPQSLDSRLDLGICLLTMGEGERAREAFEASIALKPNAHAVVGECLANIPSFYESIEQIGEARSRFESSLAKVEEQVYSGAFAKYDSAWEAFALQPFFLTYQGECDKDLLSRWAKMIAHVANEKYPQYMQPRNLADCKRKDGKIAVGIFSNSFCNHADWKMMTNGWLDQLPRDKFHLIGYSASTQSDWVTGLAKTKFDSFVAEPDFDRLAARMAGDKPHVMIYIETGATPLSMRLASLRLAPVQCAAWAKTGTSGIPNIDYFLTSDLMEPADGESHYTEKLVRLPNLSSYYVPSVVDGPQTLPTDVTRFLCVQSLFKFLPHHDELLEKIAKNVKNAEFVFTSRPQGMADKVKARLANVEKHLRFVPSLNELEYAELCRSSVAFLDTMLFSGCVTTIESLQQNLPVVTLPGKMMRSRQSAAMLQTIGADELICADATEYVEKATWLGLDRSWQQKTSQHIATNKHRMYKDQAPVEALSEFLQNIVAEADTYN